MKLKFYIIQLLLLSTPLVFSQSKDPMILSFSEFITAIRKNHPVVKQSSLLVESADAGIQASRGSFDPRLYYNLDQKQFDNKKYWTIQNGGMKIPTSFGLEVSTGVEQSEGPYLNPESVTSVNGMAYAQFSMPLLQGLLIDERRFALKNAKLFKELSLIDQKNLLNELFSKASKTYWEWVQSYYNLQVIKESVDLANQRMNGIKQSALLGENAIIDTLEAGIQLQDRKINLQQQEIDFYTKTMNLSVHLWDENNEPITLSQQVIPPQISELITTDLLPSLLKEVDSLVNTHPNILAYQNKSSRMALELKLKKDKLKPMLTLKFNPLFDFTDVEASMLYGVNSFKWGMGFQYPIFLRKERGEIKLTKIKLTDLDYEIRSKKQEITNKIKISLNEYSNIKSQAERYSEVVQNYYQLLVAEKKLFDIGESSIFMVNNREMSYINSKIKLNDLQYKYRKAGVDMLFNSGQLYNIQ